MLHPKYQGKDNKLNYVLDQQPQKATLFVFLHEYVLFCTVEKTAIIYPEILSYMFESGATFLGYFT